MSDQEHALEIRQAHGRVCDALHNMHPDQRVIIDAERATYLESAWAAYDAAVVAELHAKIKAALDPLA